MTLKRTAAVLKAAVPAWHTACAPMSQRVSLPALGMREEPSLLAWPTAAAARGENVLAANR